MSRAIGLLLVLVACGDNGRLRSDASSAPPDEAPVPDAAPDAPIDAPPPGIYDPANTGFPGTVCFNGLRYATPNLTLPYVLACSENSGVFKTTLGSPLSWSDMNAGGVTNLNGRGIATNPSGPPIYYFADASMTNNGFRSSNQGTTWVAQRCRRAARAVRVRVPPTVAEPRRIVGPGAGRAGAARQSARAGAALRRRVAGQRDGDAARVRQWRRERCLRRSVRPDTVGQR